MSLVMQAKPKLTLLVLVFIFIGGFKMLLRKNIKVEDDGQTIYAPVSGSVIPIEDVHDEVFCQKMMGDGLAIEPTEGKLYAPVSGIITVVFPTKHVIAITSMEGIDVIIHVGIDTVELKGAYFHPYVKVGDKVKAGDMLMSIDLKNIKKRYHPTTMIVIENDEDYQLFKTDHKDIQAAGELMKVKKVSV